MEYTPQVNTSICIPRCQHKPCQGGHAEGIWDGTAEYYFPFFRVRAAGAMLDLVDSSFFPMTLLSAHASSIQTSQENATLPLVMHFRDPCHASPTESIKHKSASLCRNLWPTLGRSRTVLSCHTFNQSFNHTAAELPRKFPMAASFVGGKQREAGENCINSQSLQHHPSCHVLLWPGEDA
jgi:hypothetical protein